MKPLFRLMAVSSVMLLTACAGLPDAKYFSLASSPQQAPLAAPADKAITIHLQQVALPAQVDRPQIVLTVPGSDALVLLNESVWAAPLSDEIRQALSLSLADRLGALSIDGIRAPQGLEIWNIGFTVNRFEMRYADSAALEATWRVASPGKDGRVRFCRAQAVQTVEQSGIEPLIEAQKALLQRFSSAIAADIRGEAAEPGLELQGMRCNTAAPSS